MPHNIQVKILRRKTSIKEYRVYRAALEWDLTDPIVIEKREDIKSVKRWQNRFEPYHHQVKNLITFCRRLPVTLIADDVGLGKTISAGLIISELISRSRLSSVLIVCPKLLREQWQEELLTKFNIHSEIVAGRDLIHAEADDYGAIITTYQSAQRYLHYLPKDRFQMLVLDEAHKLRNLYGVNDPPQVAIRFRKALEERRFRFVLMLTATPVQNRLWDLYSLVDLLTVARGHQNPFGSEGLFARRFIADGRVQARKLKEEARDEFRSIVYGYMSRIRRGDANLHFPDRVVQMHKVQPTPDEIRLIEEIKYPILTLNKLSQISILQSLTSSPEALMAQLNNMANNGTIAKEFAQKIRSIVTNMSISAKLLGLNELVQKLRQDNPERWRLVVFTRRLETQTAIQTFLEKNGIKVGLINGMSGSRNMETIIQFRKNSPEYHVIVSTEAGSEGVNLQVANMVVNYDLPWNPMIVEQRIGRVQRLASEHANVCVFNIILNNTFEEYIVGRLMEKLQMASHAIGDIEALLEASGIGDEDEGESFSEKIRQLVVASLQGKNVEIATQKAVQSITDAKIELAREESDINEMLGAMDEHEYFGPRAPILPPVSRSMNPCEFILLALKHLGAKITPQQMDRYLIEENGGREYIYFDNDSNINMPGIRYAPGTASFNKVVNRIIMTGIYDVNDVDNNILKESEDIVRSWISSFDAVTQSIDINDVCIHFEGTAIVRVRATVAHDSYERIVSVACSASDHNAVVGRSGLNILPHTIENPKLLGLNLNKIIEAATLDSAISEFSRFYLERREHEIKAAGDDERKKQKLYDDFTPRMEMTLASLEGRVYRKVSIKAQYQFEDSFIYENILSIIPHSREVLDLPKFNICTRSGKNVPETCLRQCEISKNMVLEHFLKKSEFSSRCALPEFTQACRLSGKRILKDEGELSAVTGDFISRSLLKTSVLSGKKAEPEHFGRCEFTGVDALNSELVISELSGKRYRIDEQLRSTVSGKTGHKNEFTKCFISGDSLAFSELEQCEITGKYVKPGILQRCEITQKKVLPTELQKCSITGKRALKSLFVNSSITNAQILEEIAIRSKSGKFCSPTETEWCEWSDLKYHPEDLIECQLTGLKIYSEFVIQDKKPRLKILFHLLNSMRRNTDFSEEWGIIASKAANALEKKQCKVEAAVFSPGKRHLAVCAEFRSLFGLRTHHIGFIYDMNEKLIIGKIAIGRRYSSGWIEQKP